MTTVSTVMDSTVSDNTGNLAPRVGPVEGLRQTFSLSWRTLVQIKHNPAELIDFSIQPVMFLLLFTFVFGGAIGGSPHAYLMFALRRASLDEVFLALTGHPAAAPTPQLNGSPR